AYAHAHPRSLAALRRTPNQSPFAPLALPSFLARMGSSDFCPSPHRLWSCRGYLCTATDLPRCGGWLVYVLRLIPRRACPFASVLSNAHRWSSPLSGRLDPRLTAFEACSGFTRVAARTLADLPSMETCVPGASAPWSPAASPR